jgi:acyl-CoA thioester hydrolase
MFVQETDITARYAETDQMGIIHHSYYSVWFETGRTDFFKNLGMRYSEVENKGVMLPLTEIKCSFIKPVRYEDVVLIKTWIVKSNCVRLVFNYEILKRAGMERVAMGETIHAWTDRSLNPINLKKVIPELYKMILLSHKEES